MTREQNIRFSNFVEKVNEGKFTMNQAYKAAKKPFVNANGDVEQGFGGNFKDWITHAQNQGWIDQAFQVLGGFINRRNQANTPPPPPPAPTRTASSPLIWIGITAAVVVGGFVIYRVAKN